MHDNQQYISASLLRRLGAIIYDSFIAFALLFFATAFALWVNHGKSLQPHQHIFVPFLILVLGTYFTYCWRKGQSLGMMAWKLVIVNKAEQKISLKHAWARFIVGLAGFYCLGITLVWCLFDPKGQALHDRICGTTLLRIAPQKKS